MEAAFTQLAGQAAVEELSARATRREREQARNGGIVFTAAAADNDADMAVATFAPSNFDPTAANLLLMAKRRKRAAP